MMAECQINKTATLVGHEKRQAEMSKWTVPQVYKRAAFSFSNSPVFPTVLALGFGPC
jgi:hypothetical protein